MEVVTTYKNTRLKALRWPSQNYVWIFPSNVRSWTHWYTLDEVLEGSPWLESRNTAIDECMADQTRFGVIIDRNDVPWVQARKRRGHEKRAVIRRDEGGDRRDEKRIVSLKKRGTEGTSRGGEGGASTFGAIMVEEMEKEEPGAVGTSIEDEMEREEPVQLEPSQHGAKRRYVKQVVEVLDSVKNLINAAVSEGSESDQGV